MILSKSSSEVVRQRHPVTPGPGPGLWITDYIGRSMGTVTTDPEPPLETLFPCAFLIEQDPGVSGGAHFHQASEFQVVVSGSGLFGKDEVKDVCVHYAGAYTPYGPLSAGPNGLAYMTLRDTYDSGAKMMPAHRELLKSGRRKPRAHVSETMPPAPEAALRSLPAPAHETVLAPEGDGLAAWIYRVPPGGRVEGPDPALGGGQFWMVVAGGQLGEKPMPPLSCTFVSSDEAAYCPQAGPAGLEILALQFPMR